MAKIEEQNFKDLYESSLKKLEEGTVVEGTIIDIIGDEVFVDLGYKADGIIPRDEFSYEDVKPSEKYRVGDKISAYILKMNNGQGNILLSTKRIQAKELRDGFEEKAKSGETISVKVKDIVNGGVVADFAGIKIFIPQTQLARKVDDLNEYRNKTLSVRIIEYEPAKRKIVASERIIAREAREKKLNDFWDNVEVGKTYEGTVRQLQPYGAFVDVGGIDGLLHVSEISWEHIDAPSDVLKVGQTIEVRILNFDKEKKKVSLTYKKLEDKPEKSEAEQ